MFRFPLLRSRLSSDSSGATIVLVAVMMPLLVAVMAVTVDLARLYVVQTKVQSALDTALMGGVATGNNRISRIRSEARRLFDVNFPRGYMGSSMLGRLNVTQVSSGVFEANVSMRVPTTILSVGGGLTTLSVISQVAAGYQTATQKTLELALVFDNSASMTGGKSTNLNTAANAMINTIFGTSSSLPNVFVSVVPYNVSVNVGPGRMTWVQPDYSFLYFIYSLFGWGFMSNRNADSPPNTFTDFSNAAPTVASARFRLPAGAPTFTSGNDIQTVVIPQIAFSLNSKALIANAINSSVAGGDLRINVGLMWGWFTLSPSWQGIWNAGLPARPGNFGALMSKSMVLVVGGKNNVFLGVSGTSDDEKSTRLLCEAIKAQGITLYVVAYAASASSVNEPMLTACATRSGNYFLAATATELNEAFADIAGDINYTTLRLTK